MEDNCDGQGSPSVYLDNANDGGNPFTTDRELELRFNGMFVLNETSNLQLLIGNLITNLENVMDADEIEDAFEDITSEGTVDDDSDDD